MSTDVVERVKPKSSSGEGGDQSFEFATRIVNPGRRTYKRGIAFLATQTGRAKLVIIARDNLTYAAIVKNLSNYQLDENDKSDIPIRQKQTMDELRDEVWNCYRRLYLTNSDGSLEEKDILGLLNRSMSQHGLASVVEDRLKQHDIITQLVSHRVVEHWPPAFQNRPWPLQSLRDNIFQNDKVTKARLIS